MRKFAFADCEDEVYDRPVTTRVLVPRDSNTHQQYWRFEEATHQRVRVGDSLVAKVLSDYHGQPVDMHVLSGKVIKIEELLSGIKELTVRS